MGEDTKKSINEREISLRDLIVDILSRWRIIVVLMIIGGAVFAGLSYAKSYQNAEAQKAKLKQMEAQLAEDKDVEAMDKQWLEEQLTEIQINNVVNALSYKALLDEKNKFQEESLIMNLDPFSVPKCDITILIKSDDYERTYNIQKIYEDLVSSSGMYEYILENCDVKYNPSEIIYLEKTSYGELEGHDSIRLYVLYDEEDMCKQIANCITDYINLQQPKLTEKVGEHEVEILDQSFSTVIHETYLNAQKNHEAEVITYRNNLTNLKTKFSDAEWRYYNYLLTGKATENPDADKIEENVEGAEKESILNMETIPEPSISIKYIILGMILFAFIYVFYAFMKYILNNKLRSTESLVDIYNMSQLGFIPTNMNKKKFLGFIDAWILSLRDRNKRKFSAEEAINMAAVAVKMATKKASSSDVYLIGCDIKNQTADVCEKIKNILSKDGIEAKVLDNVLYDAEAMIGLENAHCVVLVEKAGSTLYDEVAKELELLARQDITVLGGIVVE